jgi:hypothetical protein
MKDSDFKSYLENKGIVIEKYEAAAIGEQEAIIAAYESSKKGKSSNVANYFSKHPSMNSASCNE